jgi:hypothetical protein
VSWWESSGIKPIHGAMNTYEIVHFFRAAKFLAKTVETTQFSHVNHYISHQTKGNGWFLFTISYSLTWIVEGYLGIN